MKRRLIGLSASDPDRSVRPVAECGHPVDRVAIEPAKPDDGVDCVDWVDRVDWVDCVDCDRRLIPPITSLGRRTPTFTADSVPPALLADHRTNAWAELIVLAGAVDFEQQDPPWRATGGVGRPVVIVPGVAHRVTPGADAEFYVQFHDLPPGFGIGAARSDQPAREPGP